MRPSPHPLAMRWRIRTAPACLAAALAFHAAPLQAAQPAAGWQEAVQEAAQQTWAAMPRPDPAAPADALRFEVALGALPAMQPLAPCARMEPQWPAGMKPWGKLRVPIKCVEGAVLWKVYLPVTVKAWGRAWTVQTALPAGTALDAQHLIQQEVDFAAQPSPPVSEKHHLVGRSLARSLEAGQAIRQGDLKQRQWFAAGDVVKIVSQGNGFHVVGEGTAVSSGLEGIPVRIRMASGRVVTGRATANNEVHVSL